MASVGMDHFLGGSTLNRVSWLRNTPAFLSKAASAPSTRWLVFKGGDPLVHAPAGTPSQPSQRGSAPNTSSTTKLALLSTTRIAPLLGPTPYFAQGQEPGESLSSEWITTEHRGKGQFLESVRIHGPPVVFLGIQEATQSIQPASEVSREDYSSGTAYFAVDVASVPTADLDKHQIGVAAKEDSNASSQAAEGAGATFNEPRTAGLALSPQEASLFSEARTMLDWLNRNKYCSGCGSRTYALWGGWKLSCSSLLPWSSNPKPHGEKCPWSQGLQSGMHPRTDTVVITAVIDPTGTKILLGRNKRFPPGFYSTLAGFLEPSETIEQAVAREIWEESGVRVRDVRYHSGQPWPFPANLMMGCFAIADPNEPIRTDLDTELEDAKWFNREEVLAILGKPTVIDANGWKKTIEYETGKKDENAAADEKEGGNLLAPSEDSKSVAKKEDKKSDEAKSSRVRVPGVTAIAGVLIRAFADQELAGLGYKFASGGDDVKARI